MKTLLLSLLLSVMITGCSFRGGSGTSAGNPKLVTTIDDSIPDTQGDAPPPAGGTGFLPRASDEILMAICQKLTECHSSQMTVPTCESAVLLTTSIDTELGLVAGFGSYQDIVNAELAGTLQRGISTSTCVTGIDAMNCGSAAVAGSYSPSSPSDFDDAYKILDALPSCGEVFDP